MFVCVHVWFSKSIYAFKACVNYVHTSFWSVLFPLNARVAAVCVCLCVFSYLVAFSSMVFNGCVAMATPCLHAQSNGSFVRPLRKQAIRRHLHAHTHACSLKTESGLSIIQQYNDYAFNYYNCISPKHLYISDISVDHSYNSSKHA